MVWRLCPRMGKTGLNTSGSTFRPSSTVTVMSFVGIRVTCRARFAETSKVFFEKDRGATDSIRIWQSRGFECLYNYGQPGILNCCPTLMR